MEPQILQTDYAYIAGYLDGDGCFYIGKETNKKRLSPKYVISIVITSVNKHTLMWFKYLFGGSVCMISEQHLNKKTLYQYSMKKRNILKTIQYIFPYLVEKKDECLTALRFITSENVQVKEACINKIKIIKDVSNLVSKYHKTEFEPYRSTIEPTKEDFAYLAGFIDAECSLNIQKYKPKNKPNYVYKILLQCNNTKAPVFKWLLERFGGVIHFIDRRNHGKARKNQLTWRLSAKALSGIIDKIHPFLIHKKPVCEELMKFYATTLINGGARHTESFRIKYDAILKMREEIVDKVHKLNLKGI